MIKKKDLNKQVIETEKHAPLSMGRLLMGLVIGIVLLIGSFYFFDYREAKELEVEGDIYYELGKYPEAIEKYLFASKKQSPFIESAEIEAKISNAKLALEEDKKKEEVKDTKTEGSVAQRPGATTVKPQPGPTKSGQAMTLEFIKNRMTQVASEIVANKKIIDDESKLCSQRYPNDLNAAWECAPERERKLREATSKYNELKKEFDMLYQQFLNISGQK